MNIHFLGYHLDWFGKHIGYENMVPFVKGIDCRITLNKDSKVNRAMGKVIRNLNHWSDTRSDDAFTGWKYKMAASNYDLSHILYIETYLFLCKQSLQQKRIIGTIHLPMSQWTKEKLLRLGNLRAAIILYNEEASEFANYVDTNQLFVTKYGIDTRFYKRDTSVSVNRKKILFVGHYLRNFDLLYETFHLIKNEIGNDFEFHFVIPSRHRTGKVLSDLSAEPNVFFHQNLTDEELLLQYQTSYVMLMPMKDSGVNTAIMQALSIGLPIVTNDAGGIKTYGGNAVFPIAASEASSLADLFFRYHNNEEFREETAAKQRAFAEAELDWAKIAEQHVLIYQRLQG